MAGDRRRTDPTVPAVDVQTLQRLTARFGSRVEVWLDELPGALANVARRWRIELDEAIPGGSVSLVFGCHSLDGTPAVLKATPDRPRLALEAAALRDWPSRSTPDVFAVDEELGVLLMEAIVPGHRLADAPTYPGTSTLANLFDDLHVHPSSASRYPTVRERVRYLFDASRGLYDRYPHAASRVPAELYERGRRFADRLAQLDHAAVLCHGDLTPRNLLGAGPGRGLVAIDPAPCVGDASFDAVDLLLWRAGDRDTIDYRAGRLAATTSMDRDRILAWCCAFASMVALEVATTPGAPMAQIDLLLALAEQAPTDA